MSADYNPRSGRYDGLFEAISAGNVAFWYRQLPDGEKLRSLQLKKLNKKTESGENKGLMQALRRYVH